MIQCQLDNNSAMIQNYLAEQIDQNYLAPSYPIFIQIKSLLQSINNKKAIKSTKTDIINLVEKLGPDGQKFLLVSLLENIELKQFRDKNQTSLRIGFFAEQMKDYSFHTAFLNYFPQVIVAVSDSSRANDYICCILNHLKLPLQNQIAIALSLYLSDRSHLSLIGEQELEKKLGDLKQSEKEVQIPDKILEELLFQISRNPQLQVRLQAQFQYLLQNSEKINKGADNKVYNYLKGDWQYFANEQIVLEKPPGINLKKVQVLRDIGPTVSLSIQSLKTILSDFTPMTQEDIFESLFMIAQQKPHTDSGMQKFIIDLFVANKKNLRNEELKKIYSIDLNSKKNQTNWNVDNFITYCVQNVPNLRWQNVMGCLDRPKLQFVSEEAFLNLMKYFQKAKKQGPKFKTPQNLFFKKWNNPASQANFLYELFRCKEPQILGLHEISNRRIQKSVIREVSMSKQIWGHLDLVQLLIQVSDYKYVEIRQLCEIPMKNSDLLIQTLSEIRPSRGQAMLDQIFSQLFPIYLHNHSNYIKLLENLWEANQDLVISSICEMYKNDVKKQNVINLSRVLDIAQVIKESLIPLTNWNDYEFAVPLAILAGKRQFLHFEPWITDRIKNIGNPFLKSILSYLDENLLNPIRILSATGQTFSYESMLQKAQLSKQLLAFIFESIFLTSSSAKMSKRNFQNLKRIYKEVCLYFPQMSESQMPDEIQQQAERQFSKIYKREVTIEQAVQHMQRLKNSRKPEQTEQFASMITFMFSELRFHLDYPQKQLMITADLFGGVINANLIQRKLFNVLLQVLQYDLKEDNCKYMFALTVVKKIKSKLANEPQFCDKLIDNDLILMKDPQLVEELIKGIEPPLVLPLQREKRIRQAKIAKYSPPEPVVVQVADQEDVIAENPKKVEANDFDILMVLDRTKKLSFPDKQSKINKINTICNTLSTSNVEEKSKDLINILDSPEAIKLLAYNIVFRRITLAQGSSANEVFYRLVERLPQIQKPILSITYRILQNWFAITGKSVNDKKLNNFKNVGSWLGRLTISKGYPVAIHKLNLRQILIHTYTHQNGLRIPYNVPVVIKILQHISSHPDIFKVTNPWLGKLLGTLNQIQEKLKEDQSNTKSQIKAFFRTTEMKGVSNSSIPSTTYLNQIPLISQLPLYIKINDDQHNHYLSRGIDLKMIITKAVDDSIQQIVEPVIDRAVKIAIVTTKQLIMKDFAMETDAQKFRISSYNVVKRLAGPLAQVTCRQPLKASMNRTLKNYLNQSITNADEVQNIIARAIPDNLDLGCALIKKAVIESAEQAIKKDTSINQSIELRNQARQKGQNFRDETYIGEIPAIVPQELRPRSGGLTFQEYSVYDAFKRDKKVVLSPEKQDSRTGPERIWEIIGERGPVKEIKDILNLDNSLKEYLLQKTIDCTAKDTKDQTDIEYFLQVWEVLRDYYNPNEAWAAFKEKTDLTKKQTVNLVKKMMRLKIFPDKILNQLEEGNEEENKAINLFEKWLDTAHQEIQPFLQSLEEMFNKSQNQIRMFFQYSLNYALGKVVQSISGYDQSMDTNYIQDYSKLIIISLKIITSNNVIMYLEHTTQAILQVFNRLQNSSSKMSYQRPFFKLFLNLICDATRKQYSFDSSKVQMFYCVLAKAFHKINPLLWPNFSFAWVELISNKYFMPTLLEKEEYWDVYFELICDLLKFAREHLTEDTLTNHIYQVFYKGILRLIVILIHDFPDFLSQFSLLLSLQIPDNFIQLRNMIISVIPRYMVFKKPQLIASREELENQPFSNQTPKYFNLKFDYPKYNNLIGLIQSGDKSLKSKLEVESEQVLQTFTLYIAWPDKHQLPQLTANGSKKLLIELVTVLDGEFRDKFIKYILNLIRYPSVTTIFFIDTVMAIVFRQGHDKLRNLLLNRILERMTVESPSPWGLAYIVKQFQIQKPELNRLSVSREIINEF